MKQPPRSDARRFPAECRRFLVQLASHAELAEPPAHAQTCSSCRRHWAAARRQSGWLRHLPRERVPAQAGGIEAVYDRIIQSGERSLGNAVRKALEPAQAPADAIWQELDASPELGPSLRRLWPVRPVPGWMWGRIRAQLGRGPRPRLLRISSARAGLIAAAILVSAAALFLRPDRTEIMGGTPSLDRVVWDLRSEPIDPAFSLHALAAIGR